MYKMAVDVEKKGKNYIWMNQTWDHKYTSVLLDPFKILDVGKREKIHPDTLKLQIY
jgi:hypothetical protein